MTDFVSEASTDDHARARIVANRSVLVQVQRPQAEDPDGLLLAPVFGAKTGHDESVGLVPRIDAGLDSAHRFAVLGAVFRPMRQFLRRTFDADEETEISSDLRAGESSSISQD
ncbi:MAG TPA: hypothetical protein EYN40_01725 [Planctomycetes bacterium]|nr:hypothetical protein [Planctomycetota bacterium]